MSPPQVTLMLHNNSLLAISLPNILILAHDWYQSHTSCSPNSFAHFPLTSPRQLRRLSRLNLSHLRDIIGQE
jgi:hypothetical protein